MDHSRRDFLKVAAAGLPIVGAPWLFSRATHAREEIKGAYTQAQADIIHKRSMEEAIRQAGENPEEVKAQADRRIRELRADSTR
jgi:hypothetical protein